MTLAAGMRFGRYASCLEKMQKARCRHLPVVTDGRLAGVVALRDLLQVEIDETRDEIGILRTYINGP